MPIGGNHFTRALTKELKLTFAKAEHLKRNATKAPDPRAVFTAMRGVFNDFASEVNRSIGFYSSVNRTAKIGKVVGLGNGFKLPGLQKFLQQNLSYEVEKLEAFAHMAGDDVKGSPQFQENLPSFAVAYGLGLQGLGLGRLRTNLLPPEIERVRMVRRKKPWAMAAASLVAVGVVGLAASDYRANAKVSSEEFKGAVGSAKSSATAGTASKAKFAAAKSAWDTTLSQGNALIPDPNPPLNFPEMIRQVELALPDPTIHPVDGRHLDPETLADRFIIDKNRVHIDAIKPVWVADLAKWYADLADPTKPSGLLFHPLDRKVAPAAGEGWVIQVIGHHYNPTPLTKEDRATGVDLGPVKFLTRGFLNNLNGAKSRGFGFHHATISWLLPDTKWVGEKGDSAVASALPANVPILPRNTTPTVAAAGGGGGSQMPNMLQMGGNRNTAVMPAMPMGPSVDPRMARGPAMGGYPMPGRESRRPRRQEGRQDPDPHRVQDRVHLEARREAQGPRDHRQGAEGRRGGRQGGDRNAQRRRLRLRLDRGDRQGPGQRPGRRPARRRRPRDGPDSRDGPGPRPAPRVPALSGPRNAHRSRPRWNHPEGARDRWTSSRPSSGRSSSNASGSPWRSRRSCRWGCISASRGRSTPTPTRRRPTSRRRRRGPTPSPPASSPTGNIPTSSPRRPAS